MKTCRVCGYLGPDPDPEWEFCNECTEILVNFIKDQKKLKEKYLKQNE